MLLQCLKKGLFTWSAISLETQRSLLINIRDPKISFGCCPLLMSLMDFFSYMYPCFRQNVSHHLIIEQIPTIARLNHFKAGIKSKTGLT